MHTDILLEVKRMINPMMMQMMNIMRNPQQVLNSFLQKVPEEIRNDPNKIISWMQQSGMVTEEQIRQVRQMTGR